MRKTTRNNRLRSIAEFVVLFFIAMCVSTGVFFALQAAYASVGQTTPVEDEKPAQSDTANETSDQEEQPTVELIPEPQETEVDPLANAISVGECLISHYCCEAYEHICGTGDGLTATGVKVAPGIVAVDPDVIPLHSDVIINGVWYKAEDVGGAINGNRIDVAVETHQGALEEGIYYAEVLYIPPVGE